MNLVQDVYEWLSTAGTTVDENMIPLSINLVDEEVDELKQAIANRDKKETMDAIADIFWVTMNVAYFSGINPREMFEYFDKVSDSNWSKFTTDEFTAQLTVEAYAEGTHPDKPGVKIDTQYDKVGMWYVIRNKETGKILKSIDYKKL
ncbi:MAG: hypothetical protein EB127_19235 [Alphaproteobacteria bacterium]|nr:hypothetical protein [Alphaproteobacteria bacterium]